MQKRRHVVMLPSTGTPPIDSLFLAGSKVLLPEYPRDRRTIAYHEAGHAVVSYLQNLPILGARLHAEPLDGEAGRVDLNLDKIKSSAAATADKKFPQAIMECAAINIATMYVAGVMTELRLHGVEVNGPLDLDWRDFQNARTVLRDVFGDDAPLYFCQRLASALLADNWDWVGCVGNSIWFYGPVDVDEIGRLQVLCDERPA